MHYFIDQSRHPFFYTNNLWLDLEALRDAPADRDGTLGLPLIRNSKMVDPADSSSAPVIRLETTMGATAEASKGATAIEVPRSRSLLVKTTNGLPPVRSDAYEVDDDGLLQMVPGQTCTVSLDPRFYKETQGFEAWLPNGIPFIKNTQPLTVEGDWTLDADIAAIDEAHMEVEGSPG